MTVAQTTTHAGGSLYPSLNDEYMGLELQQYVPPGAVVPAAAHSTAVVAPVSGAGNVGMRRAEIKQGEDGRSGGRVKEGWWEDEGEGESE